MGLRGLEGKVAVVTGGAGNGMGQQTARRLAAEGCHVVIADLDGEAAKRVAAELPSAVGVQADVSTEFGVEAFVDAAVSAYGRLDLLHNNAAVPAASAPLVDASVTDFDRVLAVDLRGVFLGTQHAMRRMIAQGSGGAIVNTSALAGLTAFRGQAGYVAAKHGVIGLTRVAAAEGGPHGIRVNAICPGLIDSAASRAAVDGLMGPGAYAGLEQAQAMKRSGRATEAAAAVAFLLSDEASYVNGVAVPVDGGSVAVHM